MEVIIPIQESMKKDTAIPTPGSGTGVNSHPGIIRETPTPILGSGKAKLIIFGCTATYSPS